MIDWRDSQARADFSERIRYATYNLVTRYCLAKLVCTRGLCADIR